jgi:hypothetical protein
MNRRKNTTNNEAGGIPESGMPPVVFCGMNMNFRCCGRIIMPLDQKNGGNLRPLCGVWYNETVIYAAIASTENG